MVSLDAHLLRVRRHTAKRHSLELHFGTHAEHSSLATRKIIPGLPAKGSWESEL